MTLSRASSGSVKDMLKAMWEAKNIKTACNIDGLLEKCEEIVDQLNICKRSLKEFLDGRRRQFPRYYFTSEADLLDILSNGSTPAKIMHHTPKVYLQSKTHGKIFLENIEETRAYTFSRRRQGRL